MRVMVSSVLAIFICSFLGIGIQFCEAELKSGITYRIRSGYDGSVLTAHYPGFASDLTLKLGEVFTEEWTSSRNQLWEAVILVNRTTNSSSEVNNELFWLKPVAAVLNELTGVPRNRENPLEITEIAENSGTFLVKNAQNKLCLESRGAGQPTFFNECEELRPSQQWDFEDPQNLKVKVIKLALANFFNKFASDPFKN